MFLMETKNQDEAVLNTYRGSEYSHHFTVPPEGLSGGLALSWKPSVQLDVLYSSPNIIDTCITSNNKTFFVSYIYGAPRREERSDFWNKLSELGTQRQEAWLITGDFNDLLNNSEKVGGPPRWEGSFLAFRSFVTQYGIWDLQHSGNSLSWRGTRYSHFIQSRLDRAMANVAWSELFPMGRCEYHRFEGSDHRPVVTLFDANLLKKNKGLFRFDRRLRDKQEIRELVDVAWNDQPNDSVISKINNVRTKIVEWTKLQNSNSKLLIQSTQTELERALSDPVPDQELIASLQATLHKAYVDEEQFWRQRSRIQWLHSGDRNSSFFHSVTRSRRVLNKFSVIEDENGSAFFEEQQIVQTISRFYQDLFSSSSTGDLRVVQEVLSPKVTTEMNQTLIAIPTDLEIKDAVFSISADKAPGPDGFSAGFYQSFWDIIGPDVTRDIRSFFTEGELHRRQNETHVRLIPKISGPKKVSDYRPIALCTTHYKIIAKLLTKRLQPLLSHMISGHQSAFVPGRAIADNVLITHEILYYLRTSSARQRCSMAVKTDMSKAYDRIEWDFLREVLMRLGFHDIWISWIMECVSSVSYSFLINGAPQGGVLPSRGLRQGDPLSPYLFILCTEVLSGLCMQAQERGSLVGVKVARGCLAINHLLFADDTMFFCRSNRESCMALASILQRYEIASGQCINRTKSAITFSAKTLPNTKENVKRVLGINSEGGIGKYLGLPEHFDRKKRDIFAAIVDRIRQRSHSWSSKLLSGAGKLVLLKTVLAAMPTYAMSCFKLPVSLCKQIQAVLTRFWWDQKPEVRRLCWVAWDKLTLPKSAGGLGFRDIELFNDALLAKVAWRLLKHPDSLLGQTLLGKYCHHNDLLSCPTTGAMSHGWRGVLAGREVLKLGMGWAVGTGAKINVWTDNWLSTGTISRPIGPPNCHQQNLSVQDLLGPTRGEWNIPVIRTHLPQYEDTIRLLQPSSFEMEDAFVWLPEKSGLYTTKSGYALAKLQSTCPRTELTQHPFSWRSCVWNIKTSPKLKLFLWKLANKALPVGDALARRGILANTECKRCGERETEIHTFFLCPFAATIWDLMPVLYKPSPAAVTSIHHLLDSSKRALNLPPSGLADPLYPWVLWNLWTSRNQLIFENKKYTELEVLNKALRDAKEWSGAQPLNSPNLRASPSSPRLENTNPSTLFCFTDGAWDAGSKKGGMGWLFKDKDGTIVAQGTDMKRYVSSALMAEALALKSALLAATSLGFLDLRCLSDSSSLISLLTTDSSVTELQGILHDIRVLSSSFLSISFVFTPRLANVSADGLAKSALRLCLNSPPIME